MLTWRSVCCYFVSATLAMFELFYFVKSNALGIIQHPVLRRHLLYREEHWNAWKNDGCPSFAKKPEPGEEGEKKKMVGEGGSSRKRKRKLGDLIRRETEVKRVNLGNPGLTTLWNLTPDNLEACR